MGITWPVPLPHGRNGTVGVVTLSAGGSGKTTILGSGFIRRSYSILESNLRGAMHMHVRVLCDEAPMCHHTSMALTTGLKYTFKYMLKPEDHRALLCKL